MPRRLKELQGVVERRDRSDRGRRAGRIRRQLRDAPANRTSGALINLTAAQAVDGKASITIANPSIAAPAAITVQVAVT